MLPYLWDRPLRPMIPKGWAYDTQILQWVMSYDGVRSTDALAITAASAATAISDVPFKKPVVGVRVGLLPGSDEPTINPTMEQMKVGPGSVMPATPSNTSSTRFRLSDSF